MTRISLLTVCFCVSLFSTLSAVEHSAVKLDSPPAEGFSPEIAGLLASTGTKVVRGTSRTVCEIWLCKEVAVSNEKLPTAVNYPFAPGQLIGAMRYPKKGSDFRNQDIADGVYTIRYGQQPVDGAHVGTSVTRDFLLLLPAATDTTAATLDYKSLTKQSSQAAGSNHPALLNMLKANDGNDAIRFDEAHDWWIVRLNVKTKGGKELPVDVVIVGKAAE